MFSIRMIFGAIVAVAISATIFYAKSEHKRAVGLEKKLATKAIECRNEGIAGNAIGRLKQIEEEYSEENITTGSDDIIINFD